MLLWGAGDLLDARAKEKLEADPVFVSAATVWELEMKRKAGRLRAPEDVEWLVADAGYEQLDITFEHARTAGSLPLHHRDPFDRMLVAQARCDGLTLATADGALAAYDVPIFEVSKGS
ncbi:MAG: type II toxin-antitoxin system VapC family toxin [Actinomycetota bacterium]|nr:type II toxin-antitoxin system VapC family toxin [Actinomycetota bacterium]